MATAFLATKQLRYKRSVMVSVPGGCGKSLIAAFAMGLCVDSGDCEQVLLVYPNEYLLQRDRQANQVAYETLGAGKVRFVLMDQLNQEPKRALPNTYLIVDEADVLLYEYPETLLSLLNARARFMLLTATRGSGPFEK